MKARGMDSSVDFEDYLEAEVFDERARMVGHLACYWTDEDEETACLGVELVKNPRKTSVIPVTLAEPNERRSCVILNLPQEKVLNAPSLDCDEELESQFEEKVFKYFELELPHRRNRLTIHRMT